MKNKVLSLLGIAKVAGKLTMGMDAAKECANNKSSKLIILSCKLSEKSLKEIKFTAEKNDIKTVYADISFEEVQKFLGKKCGILSVNDEGFAKKLLAITENMPENKCGREECLI